MEIRELKNLSIAELVDQERALEAERFNMTLKLKTNQEKRVHLLKKLRRDIARIKTVVSEKRSA